MRISPPDSCGFQGGSILMVSKNGSFVDAIKTFFRLILEGMEDLSELSRNYILVIYRKNGSIVYRTNPGIALLLLVFLDLLFPALVISGLFIAFLLGVRSGFRRS